MRNTWLILAALCQLYLGIKLFVHGEVLLSVLSLLFQGVVLLAAFTYEGWKETSRVQVTKSGVAGFVLITICILPFILEHSSDFGPSSWSEVGTMLNGPLSFFMIILGVAQLLSFVVYSLFMRRHRDLD